MNISIHVQQMLLNVQLVFTTVPEMQYAWRKWDSSDVCVLQVTKLMKTLMQVVKVCPLYIGYHLWAFAGMLNMSIQVHGQTYVLAHAKCNGQSPRKMV